MGRFVIMDDGGKEYWIKLKFEFCPNTYWYKSFHFEMLHNSFFDHLDNELKWFPFGQVGKTRISTIWIRRFHSHLLMLYLITVSSFKEIKCVDYLYVTWIFETFAM